DSNGATYREPHTAAEEVLCGLMASMLGRERVGLNDNFFALGGDSISSMLLVSRARRAGLELTPRDVFNQPTVAGLAAVARPAAMSVVWDPAAGVGDVPATPIMRWLLERGGPISRFNQSVLLKVPSDIKEADLVQALQLLLDRHDVLRLHLDGAGKVY